MPLSRAPIRSTMPPRRLAQWLVVLLIAAAVPNALSQSEGSLESRIEEQKKQMQKLQREIESHRAKSQQLEKEEKNVAKQLSAIERDVALSKKLIGQLESRENLLEEQIDSLRHGIRYEGQMLDLQQRRLAARLRDMYKHRHVKGWQILLASADINDMLRRYKFQTVMAERDAALVREVTQRKQELEREQGMLTEAMVDVVQLKQERVDEDARLEKNKKQRVAMLKRIRTDQSKHDQAIEALRQSQEELKDVIGELERRRGESGDAPLPDVDFASLKGRLTLPVKGRITRKFGNERHPKFGTVTFNNGVNIAAEPGAPIRAVAAGRVEFVDWISGYGNCIILNHGGGYYTLYAHASETLVRAGQSVKSGDVIGEVGDTGSMNGFECHFEIRKSKQALDPMPWFRK